MSGRSYSINHATNTAIIKDYSFRNCVKCLTLAALIFFIVTVLLLCWLYRPNSSGIESTTTLTTVHYGVHDKVVQGRFKIPGISNNNNPRIIATTPSPIFDKSHYKYIPMSEDAHLHGPNIDDPLDEEYPAYNYPETDTIENSSKNIHIRKMDIILHVAKTTTTVADVVPNITSTTTTTTNQFNVATTTTLPRVTTKEIKRSASTPDSSQKIISVLKSGSTTENISFETTTSRAAPKLESTTQQYGTTTETLLIANTTTKYINMPPQSTTQLASILAVNVQDTTTIPVPTCPTTINVVAQCPVPAPVCETVECKKSASKMLSLLNHESDPCADFYEFTCSGSQFNKVNLDTEVYEDDDIYGFDFEKIDSNVQYMKKYKRFYDSCMAYDTTDELVLLQKHIQNLHIENTTISDKPSKLADLMSDILKFGLYGTTSKILPVIDIIMDIGPDGKFIPVITIPMDKSPVFEANGGEFYEKHCLKFAEQRSKKIDSVGKIYEIYEECMLNFTRYETVLQKSIEKLQIFGHLSDYDSKQKASKVITIVMWNIIDEIGAVTEAEKIQIADAYDPVYFSLGELQVFHPEINWQRFFTGVFNNASFLFDKVKIMYPTYLKKILNFFKTQDFDEIKSSLLAMIAHDLYVSYLDDSIWAQGNDHRKQFCAKLTVNSMKEVTTKILQNQHSDEQISYKEKMSEKIFLESKALFAESIENASWLTSGEKELFLTKVQNIKMMAKSMEFYKVPTQLTKMYADIDIQDSLVHNTLAMMKFRRKFMYSLMAKNYLENKYFWTYLVSPLEKTARSITEINSIIVVPFRLLSRSIPNANRMKQKYEIYSKLSYHISYELANFFSPTNIRKFWPTRNEVYKNFAAINLIDPYITHILNPYELELDKDVIKNTLNSRFNDDAAIRIALETYQWKSLNTDLPLPWLNFTKPQLFYITFAQQFCNVEPSRVKTSIDTVQSDKLQNYFRLNSVIMNSKHFPDQFDCNRGTNMNPSVKIEQFPHFFDAESYDDITDNAT